MRKLLAFLATFLLCTAVQAANLEVGVGASYATSSANGTWWQKGFPYKLGLTSPAFMIGATGSLSPNLDWHLDALYLGHFTSDSWDTPNDANYNASSPTHCNGACLPLVHYVGSGDIFAFAPTLDLHTTGDWKFGVRAGPMVFYQRWSMSVPNWYPSTQTSPGNYSVGPITPLSSHDHDWWVGAELGASLQHGLWTATLMEYFDNHGFPGHGADSWPPIWKHETVLMISHSF